MKKVKPIKPKKNEPIAVYLTESERAELVKKMPVGASVSRWCAAVLLDALKIKSR